MFLTGREEIDRCLEELAEMLPTYAPILPWPEVDTNCIHRLPRTATRLKLLALHAGLSTDEQLAVFEPAERGSRKVIISTNIAEVCLQRIARNARCL